MTKEDKAEMFTRLGNIMCHFERPRPDLHPSVSDWPFAGLGQALLEEAARLSAPDEADTDAIDPADCDDEWHMGADFSGRSRCPSCGGRFQVSQSPPPVAESGEGPAMTREQMTQAFNEVVDETAGAPPAPVTTGESVKRWQKMMKRYVLSVPLEVREAGDEMATLIERLSAPPQCSHAPISDSGERAVCDRRQDAPTREIVKRWNDHRAHWAIRSHLDACEIGDAMAASIGRLERELADAWQSVAAWQQTFNDERGVRTKAEARLKAAEEVVKSLWFLEHHWPPKGYEPHDSVRVSITDDWRRWREVRDKIAALTARKEG